MAETDLLAQKASLIMELRRQGIRNTAVLAAIEKVPREAFLPEVLRQHAYDNVSLPISQGQTISQPYIVAMMTDALELTGSERVLEIGTGSGYQAAVLAALCRRVYSIERLRPLLVEAERLLFNLKITNLTARHGDGAEGWPEVAPFDRIILTCAAPARPTVLVSQLKPGGVMVAPVNTSSDHQKIRRYRLDENSVCHEEDIVDARFVPLVTNVDIDP
jgi:protein-L-isoaspartate(D-aspartate) O-methyltransferase